MASVFGKLNLKDQATILVLGAPDTFEPQIAALHGVTVLRNLRETSDIEFSLAFVTKQNEVDTLANAIAHKAKGDAMVWFAYPKQTSRKYKCGFNRDTGWQALGDAGFEPVRMIAIDEDWSAIRFRRVEFIKTMTRGKTRTLSKEAKLR
jgi:hypothetical protein